MKKVLKKLKEEKGSEALQSLLMSGIALVLVIFVFFPAMKSLFSMTSDTITTWWEDQSDNLFKDVSDDLY